MLGVRHGESEFFERHKAQFLTVAYKLIETAGKTTAMFEGAQQHIGDKGAHDLHRQGILTFPDRALDFEHLLDPLPPVLYPATPVLGFQIMRLSPA